MFDTLQDLRDEHYQLRGDISDKIARELRSEHDKVNEGLKDIRQNVGANYSKGKARLKNGEENLSPNRVRPELQSDKKDDAKYGLLLKRFNDLQKDYEILKVQKKPATHQIKENMQLNPSTKVENENERMIAGYFNSFTGSNLQPLPPIQDNNGAQNVQTIIRQVAGYVPNAGANPVG